jgi:hypothetical protein
VAFYKARHTSEKPLSKQLMLAVGWHAFVNGPKELRDPILTTLGDGKPVQNNLVDGEEVEVLGWRPRTLDGIRYQIRRLSDGHEWWICAPFLRKTRAPAA